MDFLAFLIIVFVLMPMIAGALVTMDADIERTKEKRKKRLDELYGRDED